MKKSPHYLVNGGLGRGDARGGLAALVSQSLHAFRLGLGQTHSVEIVVHEHFNSVNNLIPAALGADIEGHAVIVVLIGEPYFCDSRDVFRNGVCHLLEQDVVIGEAVVVPQDEGDLGTVGAVDPVVGRRGAAVRWGLLCRVRHDCEQAERKKQGDKKNGKQVGALHGLYLCL